MKPLARKARDAGATVPCCQLAGHCGTATELAGTPRQDWFASVEAGLLRLEQSFDTIVVGLSMGALLAARLAAGRPALVHGLIMLAPTLRYDGWSIPW